MATLPHSHLTKALTALAACLRRPVRTLGLLQRGLAAVYREQVSDRSPLPEVSLHDLAPPETVVRLADFQGREGNVTQYELLVIGTLVSHRRPRVLLEIGTFDGNTTLQLAHNSPEDARIYTLDLPTGENAAARLDPKDNTYITDTHKLQRKYAGTAVGHKVIQCLGDSATFDFHSTLEHGRPELVFIDGSHSYDYVRNDTGKVFEILAPGGIVLWHDYVPAWPGVMTYLDELGSTLPLKRIKGTALVCLETATSPSPADGPRTPGPVTAHRTAAHA